MALVDLELPEWDENNKRDRLTGCSMTGFEDATNSYSDREKAMMLSALRDKADSTVGEYSYELRDVKPLLVTCTKPEGSLSLVAGGVSPGLHNSHSPYFIRRIRLSPDDSLARMAVDIGWTVHKESNTTWVIDFPVKSGASVTKDDVSALAQLDRYLMFQRQYSQHNTSNTITVRPHEWRDLESAIKNVWDEFVGVSFLSHDGGTYTLAPYEAITKEEYEELAAKMKPFDPAVLAKYERGEEHILDDFDPTCATGSCPVR